MDLADQGQPAAEEVADCLQAVPQCQKGRGPTGDRKELLEVLGQVLFSERVRDLRVQCAPLCERIGQTPERSNPTKNLSDVWEIQQ